MPTLSLSLSLWGGGRTNSPVDGAGKDTLEHSGRGQQGHPHHAPEPPTLPHPSGRQARHPPPLICGKCSARKTGSSISGKLYKRKKKKNNNYIYFSSFQFKLMLWNVLYGCGVEKQVPPFLAIFT